ncbi:hypothetical protein MBSD_n1577 [Mizugakiibacter sediminis]|uniref:Phage virion morphogenesis protein n=1 Tax=Mizugakiibacter sediminis TaxID=1475481 RepID=A0A0K8QN35_9GAMM|nr:phage virion morphogenesis protein [Mizugakiibacter sediminis]GAP66273.1 hypothetical protein MBSD_n1577 [Mizugakiibacter sediminis]
MAGAMIEVRVDGRAGAELARIADRAGDLADALREFGEYLLESHDRRFAQGVAPNGAPWAPLAASTLARKRGPGILRESQRLRQSLRYQLAGDTLQFGTDVVYAAAQQFGLPARTLRPKHGKALWWPGLPHPVAAVHHPGLPPRPFIGVSDDDLAELGRIVAGYLLDGATA